jgi:hypothetical protein
MSSWNEFRVAELAHLYELMYTTEELNAIIEELTQRFLDGKQEWTEFDMDTKTALLTALNAQKEKESE